MSQVFCFCSLSPPGHSTSEKNSTLENRNRQIALQIAQVGRQNATQMSDYQCYLGDCTLSIVVSCVVWAVIITASILCCCCCACCACCPCNKHHQTTVVASNNQNIFGTQQAPYTTLPGGADPQKQYAPPQPAVYAPVAQQYVPPQRTCEYDGRCFRQAPDHWINVVHKLQDGPIDRPKPGAASVLPV